MKVYYFDYPGEYVKDVNFSLLGQERLLEHRFPRPVMEKGYCMFTGTWAALEEADRDPNTGEVWRRGRGR